MQPADGPRAQPAMRPWGSFLHRDASSGSGLGAPLLPGRIFDARWVLLGVCARVPLCWLQHAAILAWHAGNRSVPLDARRRPAGRRRPTAAQPPLPSALQAAQQGDSGALL